MTLTPQNCCMNWRRVSYWTTTVRTKLEGESYHAEPGRLSGTAVAADGEEVGSLALGIVGLLDLEKLESVVHVTSGLDRAAAETLGGLVGLVEAALLHVPARRLGAEVDLDHDEQGRDGGGTHHPAPLGVHAEEIAVLESNRGDITKADAEGGPHLPHHSEGTADVLGGRLGGVDGGGGGLGADGETKSETGDEEVGEGVGGGHPETSDDGDGAGEEDGEATATDLVEDGVGPAAEEGRAQVGSAVHETLHLGSLNVEGPVVVLLGTVDGSLVHALDDGRAGAQGAEEVQHERLVPLVGLLAAKENLLLLADGFDVLESASGVADLGEQGTLAEVLAVLDEVPLLDEGVDVGEDLLCGHASQGVAEESSRGSTTAAQDGRLAALLAGSGLLVGGAIAAGVAALGVLRSLDIGTRGRHGGGLSKRVYQ